MCDLEVCGIHYGDCPYCWIVPTIPIPPPRREPDHIIDTVGLALSRLLRESVEDIWASLCPGRPLLAMLYDVRRRPADGVILDLLRKLVQGPLREIVKDIVRETMIEELPGALVALDLLPDTTEFDTEGGAD